jgi:hypothetical protein
MGGCVDSAPPAAAEQWCNARHTAKYVAPNQAHTSTRCVQDHLLHLAVAWVEHAAKWAAWSSVSVVNARADSSSAFVWVDVAEHDHNSCVVSRIVRTFFVMLALLTEFTILVPCVRREFEHLVVGLEFYQLRQLESYAINRV